MNRSCTSRRDAMRCAPAGPTTIKVYSNLDSVELFVDGKSLQLRRGDDIHRFTWDVVLSEGPVRVRALSMKQGQPYEDEVIWTVSPSATTRYATPGMIETTPKSW